jgi:serine/threonine protein kinase
MILLDIINNIDKEFNNSDSTDFIDKTIILKFTNNYQHYNSINCEFLNDIVNITNFKKGESINVKCKICNFLGSGSYGKVFKIKINKKYYALKINENEIPENLKMRYESLVGVEQLKKYIIKFFISGNLYSDKYKYFSIMEYGGQSLKSRIPFESEDEIKFILRQLYNIVYLCGKYRLYLTDFKFNNIVINDDYYRLKLIDIYIQCKNYNPCKECKIVKTYSTIEIDRIKNILDDENYNHTYHYIPLAIGLIDLLCKKSFSNIISNLTTNFSIDLSLKQVIPLIQIAIYNYEHETNSLVKEYYPIYKIKKNIENKYPIIKNNSFYKYLMNLIEVRNSYKNIISTKKLHSIIHNLFSAYPNDRTLDPFKKHLAEYM